MAFWSVSLILDGGTISFPKTVFLLCVYHYEFLHCFVILHFHGTNTVRYHLRQACEWLRGCKFPSNWAFEALKLLRQGSAAICGSLEFSNQVKPHSPLYLVSWTWKSRIVSSTWSPPLNWTQPHGRATTRIRVAPISRFPGQNLGTGSKHFKEGSWTRKCS